MIFATLAATQPQESVRQHAAAQVTVELGGRHYNDFPVNSYVAETRRISRFWNYGHTPGVIEPPPDLAGLNRFHPHGHAPGPMAPPREETNPEYPHTLELRRPAM